MINTVTGLRLLLTISLLGGAGLLVACSSDSPIRTTTTERTSTSAMQPAMPTTVVTTKTSQSSP
jgi:hypothetical protein